MIFSGKGFEVRGIARQRVVTTLAAVLMGASLLGPPANADTGQAPAPETATSSTPTSLNPQAYPMSQTAKSEIIKTRQLPNGEQESTVRVGPFTLPAYDQAAYDQGAKQQNQQPDDVHAMGPGPDKKHGAAALATGALFEAPCTNCFITGASPTMVYEDGREANYHTDTMLHHMVLLDRSKSDVSCTGSWPALAGRRLFASGNERTEGKFEQGQGLHFGATPMTWVMLHLMNMKPTEQEVYFEMTMTHVPDTTKGMEEVTPVWLDVDNCGQSTHPVPQGPSRTTWTWNSSLNGQVVRAGGHLHDGGLSAVATNKATGDRLCKSNAGYDTNPQYMGHIENMSTCTGKLGKIKQGDQIELAGNYDANYDDPTAMTIMVVYVNEDGTK